MSFIIAHDLGTTGNKATLYKTDGKLIASSFFGYKTYYPGPNMVEQDPEEWWQSVKNATCELVTKAKIDSNDIKAISFSGQMMGVVPVGCDGNALRRAIIWADQRSVKQAEKLEAIGNNTVYEITGTRITPTYSGPKIAWIKDNEPKIYKQTRFFLSAKDFIVYKLTGEFGTDYSDASMTLLFDLKNLRWSEKLVEALELEIGKLPPVSASTTVVSTILSNVSKELGLPPKTLVVRGGGDGACASLGAGVIQPGEAYIYLGSSSWVSTSSTTPFYDEKLRTFNFAHVIEGLYCPTGTMQAGGASYQWAKDHLCKEEQLASKLLGVDVYSLMDDIVDQTKAGAQHLIFLPYLLGERSPRWNANARGSFIGLSITHSKSDMLRAVLEGVAFNLKIIFDILESDKKFSKIRLIGGGAKGRNWKQIISDIFGRKLMIPSHLEEATSIGAALIGAIGIEELTLNEAALIIQDVETIIPDQKKHEYYERLFRVFDNAYYALVETYEKLANL